MAEGLNKVMLLGNLGADPELKTTTAGLSVLRMRLATSETYLDKNNQRQERTEWHRVTLWGKRGEALARFLKKGDRIFIEGGLRTSSYEKNGEKQYSTEIVASNVILSGGGAARGDGQRPAGGGGRQAPGRPYDGEVPHTPAGQGDACGNPHGPGLGADDDIPF